MIYIVTFAVTAIMLQIAASDNGIKRKLAFLVALIIPVLLAAFRSYEVGIDTGVYAWPLIQIASNMSLSDFITYTSLDGIEIGYTFLTYICANYLGGLPVLLGIVQLVTIGCMFSRIWDFKNQAPMYVMSLLYMFLLYNRSLNLIRQCMAMAIVFFATRYLPNNKKRFIVLTLIATLFHNSAILGLVYLVLDYVAIGKLSKFKSFMISAFVLFSVYSYDTVLVTVVKLIFGDDAKYLKYFEVNSSGHLSLYDLAFKLIAIAMVLLLTYLKGQRKRLSNMLVSVDGTLEEVRGDSTSLLFLLISIFNFALYLLTRFNGDSYRFALYFQMMMPVILPQFRKLFDRKSRLIIDVFMVLLAFSNWYIFMIVGDGYGTIPYVLAK